MNRKPPPEGGRNSLFQLPGHPPYGRFSATFVIIWQAAWHLSSPLKSEALQTSWPVTKSGPKHCRRRRKESLINGFQKAKLDFDQRLLTSSPTSETPYVVSYIRDSLRRLLHQRLLTSSPTSETPYVVSYIRDSLRRLLHQRLLTSSP